MAEERIVNGIDAGALSDVMQAVKESPDMGQFTFRARNRWAGGTHVATTIQDFTVAGQQDTSRPWPFVFDGGEPEVLLGTNEGPNATEALLHALATCVGTTLVYHAAHRGVELDELEVDAEGDLDLRGFLGVSDEVRRGFRNIRLSFRIRGDASEDQLRELCRIGQKYSPVFDCVTNQVPVSARVEIRGTGTESDVSFAQVAQKEAA